MQNALDVTQIHELKYHIEPEVAQTRDAQTEKGERAKHDRHPCDITNRPAFQAPFLRPWYGAETNEITRIYATPLYIVGSAVFESYQMKMKNHVNKEATKVDAMSV